MTSAGCGGYPQPKTDEDGTAGGLEPSPNPGSAKPIRGAADSGGEAEVQGDLDEHLQQGQGRGPGEDRAVGGDELGVKGEHEDGRLRVDQLHRHAFAEPARLERPAGAAVAVRSSPRSSVRQEIGGVALLRSGWPAAGLR